MRDIQGRIGEERRGFQISMLLLSQREALSKWLNLSESQVPCLKLGLSMWCSEGQDDEHSACCKVAWGGYLSGYSPNIHLAAHPDLYGLPLLHFLEREHSLARPGLGLRTMPERARHGPCLWALARNCGGQILTSSFLQLDSRLKILQSVFPASITQIHLKNPRERDYQVPFCRKEN